MKTAFPPINLKKNFGVKSHVHSFPDYLIMIKKPGEAALSTLMKILKKSLLPG